MADSTNRNFSQATQRLKNFLTNNNPDALLEIVVCDSFPLGSIGSVQFTQDVHVAHRDGNAIAVHENPGVIVRLKSGEDFIEVARVAEGPIEQVIGTPIVDSVAQYVDILDKALRLAEKHQELL